MKSMGTQHKKVSIRRNFAFHVNAFVTAAGMIFMILLTVHPASATLAQSDQTFAFVNVNVIPMDMERVLESQTVIVQGDRIIAIGAENEVSVPPEAQVINGDGRFLIPGLTDTHFHILDNMDSLILAIANGVTTVRDPNADYVGTGQEILAARDQIAAGERVGPSITAAKSIIGASERVQFLFDNVDKVVGPWFSGDWGAATNIPTDPATGRALVYKAFEEGYDIIKVNWYLTRETFDSVINTAAELGMPVLAHVPADVGIEHSIRSGVEIQHNGNLLAFYAKNYVRQPGPNYLDAFDLSEADQRLPELVRLMADNKVAFTPTMAVDVTAFELFDNLPDWSQAEVFQRPGYRYVPPAYISQWTNAAGGEFGVVAKGRGVSSVAEIVPPPTARKEILALHLRQLKALVDAGVPVMTGTDASAVGVVWGFAIHEELELFVKAGLSPYQALEASTRIPAEVVGDPQEWGTIEEGKRADMVLLNANPLDNISNTRDIEGVMARGRWLSRETLQGMLDDLAATYEAPKTIQLIAASVLAFGALIYSAIVVRGLRIGRRRLGWDYSWGKIVRIVLLVVILAVWWVFWHTDTVLSHILGTLPDNAVTVRMLVPWPTAFVWISWAVTLWLLAWMAVTFVPKVKKIR
ncbi:MAG TPA: amidohydrolase family protein [Anaerolineales bacterium]|nr:amidohydrolase family protein [Anaerolineales bacterium]